MNRIKDMASGFTFGDARTARAAPYQSHLWEPGAITVSRGVFTPSSNTPGSRANPL